MNAQATNNLADNEVTVKNIYNRTLLSYHTRLDLRQVKINQRFLKF